MHGLHFNLCYKKLKDTIMNAENNKVPIILLHIGQSVSLVNITAMISFMAIWKVYSVVIFHRCIHAK